MPDENANLSSPGGSASPGPGADTRRVLASLSEAESLELLASVALGRLVYSSRYGPIALPVTYLIDAESIVLGTWDPVLFDEDLRTGIAQADYEVAVEVDQIDVAAREGWFVLVRGAAHHLDSEAERAPFVDAGLEPWIEGVPAHFIRVHPSAIWGSRLRELGERLGSDQATLPEGLVEAMGQDRQWVVDTLRHLGYVHEAEEAARVLPDPVEMEQLSEFGDRYGISMADLTSQMGGSP